MSVRSSEFYEDMNATFIQDDKGDLVSVELGKTRVILITRRYGIEKFNPVWGTKCADVGTVMRVSKSSGNISVDWDNCSMTMLYNHKDLRIHKEMPSDNPNMAFKVSKRKSS